MIARLAVYPWPLAGAIFPGCRIHVDGRTLIRNTKKKRSDDSVFPMEDSKRKRASPLQRCIHINIYIYINKYK